MPIKNKFDNATHDGDEASDKDNNSQPSPSVHPLVVIHSRESPVAYNAEILFDGKHYLIGAGFESPLAAWNCAQAVAGPLIEQFRPIGLAALSKYPKVKT